MCSSRGGSVCCCGVASKPAGASGRRLCSKYQPPTPAAIGSSMVSELEEKISGRIKPKAKIIARVMPKDFSEVDLPSEFFGRYLFSHKLSSYGDDDLVYISLNYQASSYSAL